MPICTCGACACNIVTQVKILREDDYLHHFLIGLDRAYASIRTNLLGQELLSMLDKAYQQVIQAERLCREELSSSKEEQDSIMAFKFSLIHVVPQIVRDRPHEGRGLGRGEG